MFRDLQQLVSNLQCSARDVLDARHILRDIDDCGLLGVAYEFRPFAIFIKGGVPFEIKVVRADLRVEIFSVSVDQDNAIQLDWVLRIRCRCPHKMMYEGFHVAVSARRALHFCKSHGRYLH